MKEITLSPVTRISGLLSIDIFLDASSMAVSEANCIGEQFRGFEMMMKGRKVTDAVYFMQRICGICSMAHGFTSARMIEKLYGIQLSPELTQLQQAMLGAEFLQNHIRHFYLLALPDYLNSDLLPNIISNVNPGDSRFDQAEQRILIEHYFTAMELSRKCHDMLAIFGGKIPHQHGLNPEGVAVPPTADRRVQFLSLLKQVQEFLSSIMLPDVYLLAKVYADYFKIGTRPARYISFGLFDPSFGGHFPAGIFNEGEQGIVNPEDIRESITFAWYDKTDSEIRPEPEKPVAYSWVKAARYRGLAYEGGPLARKIINSGSLGNTATGVMARLVARAEEAFLIAKWMEDWMINLPENGNYIMPLIKPVLPQAFQINDAPRGPLLHNTTIAEEVITSYNIITPSTWNFSPKDEIGQRGSAEEALVGTIIADPANPVELGRIIRSFDPCLSCATHLIDPTGRDKMSVNIIT